MWHADSRETKPQSRWAGGWPVIAPFCFVCCVGQLLVRLDMLDLFRLCISRELSLRAPQLVMDTRHPAAAAAAAAATSITLHLRRSLKNPGCSTRKLNCNCNCDTLVIATMGRSSRQQLHRVLLSPSFFFFFFLPGGPACGVT